MRLAGTAQAWKMTTLARETESLRVAAGTGRVLAYRASPSTTRLRPRMRLGWRMTATVASLVADLSADQYVRG